MPACRVNRDKGYRFAWQIKYLAIQNARRREWSALTEGSARNEAAILSTDYRSIDFQRTRISSAFLFLSARVSISCQYVTRVFFSFYEFSSFTFRDETPHKRENVSGSRIDRNWNFFLCYLNDFILSLDDCL